MNACQTPGWQILIIDLQARTIRKIERVFTNREAAYVVRRWNRLAEELQAIAIPWPTWAGDLDALNLESI
jgi:hypothetical protein